MYPILSALVLGAPMCMVHLSFWRTYGNRTARAVKKDYDGIVNGAVSLSACLVNGAVSLHGERCRKPVSLSSKRCRKPV